MQSNATYENRAGSSLFGFGELASFGLTGLEEALAGQTPEERHRLLGQAWDDARLAVCQERLVQEMEGLLGWAGPGARSYERNGNSAISVVQKALRVYQEIVDNFQELPEDFKRTLLPESVTLSGSPRWSFKLDLEKLTEGWQARQSLDRIIGRMAVTEDGETPAVSLEEAERVSPDRLQEIGLAWLQYQRYFAEPVRRIDGGWQMRIAAGQLKQVFVAARDSGDLDTWSALRAFAAAAVRQNPDNPNSHYYDKHHNEKMSYLAGQWIVYPDGDPLLSRFRQLEEVSASERERAA